MPSGVIRADNRLSGTSRACPQEAFTLGRPLRFERDGAIDVLWVDLQ